MRNEADVNRALQTYADTVRRICFMHLKNHSDAEDVFQEVFLKFALREASFENYNHEKAWIIRVAINACRDLSRSFFQRGVTSLNDADIADTAILHGHRDVLDAVLRLKPPKYRDVIYLHYYEGYKAAEIAAILGRRENTIYTWLSRARAQLRPMLGGEPIEG